MKEKTFWALMDGLSRHPGDRSERLEWLLGELRRRPAAEGVEFQARLEAACEAVATDALWRAVSRIEGGLVFRRRLRLFRTLARGSGARDVQGGPR
ncbi:DUF4240 domain-containing protein [Streptomyces coeruleoprunus]|uniref:DUF4240 domain-containing protein n=1 Tax=Streptomyces coeruleoprunus TaxID=285563 RepID=A0ABV9XF68_9ACTN